MTGHQLDGGRCRRFSDVLTEEAARVCALAPFCGSVGPLCVPGAAASGGAPLGVPEPAVPYASGLYVTDARLSEIARAVRAGVPA